MPVHHDVGMGVPPEAGRGACGHGATSVRPVAGGIPGCSARGLVLSWALGGRGETGPSWLAAAELVGEVAPDATDLDRLVEKAVKDETAEIDAERNRWPPSACDHSDGVAWGIRETEGADRRRSDHRGNVAGRWLDWSIVSVESCRVPTESAAREVISWQQRTVSNRRRSPTVPEEPSSCVPSGPRIRQGSGSPNAVCSTQYSGRTGQGRRPVDGRVDTPPEPPDPADPALRMDVQAELLSAAVKRQLIGREVWLGQV